MSEPFVPLTFPGAPPASAGAPGFRLKVVARARAKEPFTPVVLENPSATPVAGQPAPASSSCAKAEPVITVQREGDRVTSIRIKCTCGEVLELNCVY